MYGIKEKEESQRDYQSVEDSLMGYQIQVDVLLCFSMPFATFYELSGYYDTVEAIRKDGRKKVLLSHG